MSEKIVVIDFAGTLVKAEMIEEANRLRADILQKSLPTKEQHADPDEFYKVNREFVQKLTGIAPDTVIRYRKNDVGFMDLDGEQVQNQISTNLFQLGMYIAAKDHGSDICPAGLISQLERIRSAGYKLAIVTGVRTDIVSGMLSIAKIPLEFDYIYGQPPILGIENQQQDIDDLKKKGVIEFAIGDKLSDLERTPDAKNIFVRWGHPAGGEEEYADFSIDTPDELEEIIKG
jgi:phosphoglycolate phosphatase-like HAD superfamily hydrolase